MFVCLEISTDDIGIWKQIDEILYSKYGLTHIVWGVDEKRNVNLPCTLPSNLFYAKVSITASELKQLVTEKVRGIWSGGYSIIALDTKTWSQTEKDHPKQSCFTAGVMEELGREA
jgi:hypothetical protein